MTGKEIATKKEASSFVIRSFAAALVALRKAQNAQEAKGVADGIAAVLEYSRRQRLGDKIRARGHAIWAEAVKQEGSYLRQEKMAKGGRPRAVEKPLTIP